MTMISEEPGIMTVLLSHEGTYLDIRPYRKNFNDVLGIIVHLRDNDDCYTDIFTDGDIIDTRAPHILLKVEGKPISEAYKEIHDIVKELCLSPEAVRVKTLYRVE